MVVWIARPAATRARSRGRGGSYVLPVAKGAGAARLTAGGRRLLPVSGGAGAGRMVLIYVPAGSVAMTTVAVVVAVTGGADGGWIARVAVCSWWVR